MLWYLTRDYSKGIVYNGSNLNFALDGEEAVDFYNANPKFSKYKILSLYGKEYEFEFPDNGIDPTTSTAWKDITYEWYEKCLKLANLGYISDYTLGAHKGLTEAYYIYTNPSTNQYQLVPKYTVTLKDIDPTNLSDEEKEEIKETLSFERKTTDLDGYYIMMKERVMDYHQPNPIKYRPTKNSVVKEFKVGETYEVKLPSTRNHPPIIIDHNYTAALRYNMLHRAFDEWNSNPKNKNYQRTSLLQWWQVDALKRMGRRTVLLCPRRSGKTILLALEILKEMLSKNYKSWTRPRTVLFISKAFDAVEQVMDYIRALIVEFDWMKDMFHYDSTKHTFYMRTYDEHKKPLVLAQCKFYSALWTLPWVWDAADAVFFDEAMYIPTYVKDNLMKIVTNEWARLLVVSTFYDEDEDGSNKIYYWPIELCNKFEQESSKIQDIDSHILSLWDHYKLTGEQPDECAGLRYTIDDVEVITHKDIAKDELSNRPDSYMRQLYCRMAEKKAVLNYKPYILPVSYQELPLPQFVLRSSSNSSLPYTPILTDFKRVVTAYDPAQTGDISAFLATAYDEKRNKIVVFREWQLNYKDKSSFLPQANKIKEILKWLEIFKCPVLKTIDSTHQAIVDVMWWQRIFFQYLYYWVWGNDVRKWVRASEERVPKKLMVEAAQTLFDNWRVEIWDQNCSQLIEQLSNFVEYKNTYTNMSKYQWQGKKHDDFVDCLLMCLWTYWTHLWLSHNSFKVDIETENSMIQKEEKDPHHLLDDSSTRPYYTNIKNAFWY